MAFICSHLPQHILSPHPRSGCVRSPLPPPRESVRASAREYAPNFFSLMGLPKILTHGAPLARFARRSSAIIRAQGCSSLTNQLDWRTMRTWPYFPYEVSKHLGTRVDTLPLRNNTCTHFAATSVNKTQSKITY